VPTYTCYSVKGHLSTDNKHRAAEEITRVHNEITGAATFFAQVLFVELEAENYFVGGKPLKGSQVFLNGQIRAGRSALDRTRLLKALHAALASAIECEANSVWVYLNDLPARDMIEYGHVLPEPGDEAKWLAALPDHDRIRMTET
jgi:phenylpyruvate tautomerase PptA (4-oxalocrotonate tautomerase family)